MLSLIEIENSNEQLKLLRHLKDKVETLKELNNHLDIYGKMTFRPTYFKMKQEFVFNFRFPDENKKEKIIKINTINIEPEVIHIRDEDYIYDNTFEFRIESSDNTLKDNGLKLTYKKNKYIY